MHIIDDSRELYEAPLSDKELKRAEWYLAHRARLHRASVVGLIILDAILLTTVGFGFVRLARQPTGTEIARNLAGQAIEYESFRNVLEPQALVISDVSLLSSGNDDHDLIARVSNPNSGWFAEKVVLQFTTPNRVLQPINAFFLPGEERLIPLLRAEGVNRGDRVSVIISDINWRRVRGQIEAAPFAIGASRMETLLVGSAPVTQVVVPVKNTASRGYWEAHFLLIVKRGNQLVGVRQAVVNKFRSGEATTIEARWPGRFPQDIDVSVVPIFNPFDLANILPLDLER